MSGQSQASAEIDPALVSLVDELVSKRIDRQLEDIRTQIAEALDCAKAAESAAVSDRVTMVVFSGDLDKLMAAFIVATGAAAMGMEVSMFFTFWGLAAVKKKAQYKGKPLTEKMMAVMLPSGPDRVGTSKMNMLGLGPAFFKMIMGKKKVQSLPELIELAREMEVKMVACEMSMDVMGIKREELIDGLEYGGVATYLGDASDSKVTLFI
jgi:peroxiredoxin family protein